MIAARGAGSHSARVDAFSVSPYRLVFDWSRTMTTVGAYEAKTHLPRLLEQVESGQVVTVTKHGRAIARLVPAGPTPTTATEAIAELRRARSGVRRGRASVMKMIDEGRLDGAGDRHVSHDGMVLRRRSD